MPEVIHSAEHYENNRSGQSHESTSVRERGVYRIQVCQTGSRGIYLDFMVIAFSELGRAVAST
jgi:putative transposase